MHKNSEEEGPRLSLVNVLMAVPPAAPPYQPMMPAAPMPMMESPDTGRVRTGLLVAGIGLVISAFIGFVGFNFIGGLIILIGGIVAFTGTKAYPNARGLAIAGVGLMVVAFVVGIVSYVVLLSVPALPILATPSLTDLRAYIAAYLNVLLLQFVAGLIAWIGILVFPMKLVTGSAKGLTIAGGVLGIIGAILVLVFVYQAFAAILSSIQGGTITDPALILGQVVVALLGLVLGAVVGFIGFILAGVGYIIGRRKLVPAGGPAAPAMT